MKMNADALFLEQRHAKSFLDDIHLCATEKGAEIFPPCCQTSAMEASKVPPLDPGAHK